MRVRINIPPGTRRSYVDKQGNNRELTALSKVPYLVDWHIKQNPCEAWLWKDESGAVLQIPERAWKWSKIKYQDT